MEQVLSFQMSLSKFGVKPGPERIIKRKHMYNEGKVDVI